MTSANFEAQLKCAAERELHGWDFSWLNTRTREESPPWDYRQLVLERMRGVQALLDIGTGGGEFFASLFQPPISRAVPPVTWATEGYAPNVEIARQRLTPLGIQLMDVSDQTDSSTTLPANTFELVIDRHEGIPGSELFRILKPGGRYLTQQVGGLNCIELNRFLGGNEPLYIETLLEKETQKLHDAGLRIIEAREALPRWTFLDLAGVVFYLKVIPWQMPDFSVEKYRDKLYEIHQIIEHEGGFTVHQHRLLIEAEKPV